MLKNKCDKTKGGIWLIIEHITHFTALEELSLEEAEAYTYILFKMLDELKPK